MNGTENKTTTKQLNLNPKEQAFVRKKKGMTIKQGLFIKEYLIDFNATQAVIRAGYSRKRASEIGYQLLQKTTVQNAIQEAMKEREKRTEITQDAVLKELALIAFADMKDYVEVLKDGSVQAKTWDEMPEGASRAVQEIKEVRRIIASGTGQNKDMILEDRISYKHHSKVQALELLGNHLGMWKDKQELTFPDSETFELPKLKIPDKGRG